MAWTKATSTAADGLKTSSKQSRQTLGPKVFLMCFDNLTAACCARSSSCSCGTSAVPSRRSAFCTAAGVGRAGTPTAELPPDDLPSPDKSHFRHISNVILKISVVVGSKASMIAHQWYYTHFESTQDEDQTKLGKIEFLIGIKSNRFSIGLVISIGRDEDKTKLRVEI